MEKETLIKKWLNNDLTAEEQKTFESLDDYQSLVKLQGALHKFKAPDFNSEEAYDNLSKQIGRKQNHKRNWQKPVLRIAALLAIFFNIYYFTTNTEDVYYATIHSEKTHLTLPDASMVTLNAKSTLTYSPKNWDKNRELNLNGEAFFKVTKGEKFTVITSQGSVTVLGTEFNVNNRKDIFKVTCYEGSVKVITGTKTSILKPGNSFLILKEKYITTENESLSGPNWLKNESKFSSMPYRYVLEEFERQYNVSIDSKNIDTKVQFTGSFTHENMELALKSITLPLNINYSIKNQLIELSRE